MFDEREPAEPELTADLKAIEGRLARLVPAGAQVDRDRLMYEAGMAAGRAASELSPSPSLRGRGNVWVWRAASAFMTAATLLLGTMLVWQQQSFELALQQQNQRAVARQIVSEQPSTAPASMAGPDVNLANWIALKQPTAGYLGVRYTALMRGVDAIEPDDVVRGSRGPVPDLERNQRDILEDLLHSSKRESNSRS